MGSSYSAIELRPQNAYYDTKSQSRKASTFSCLLVFHEDTKGRCRAPENGACRREATNLPRPRKTESGTRDKRATDEVVVQSGVSRRPICPIRPICPTATPVGTSQTCRGCRENEGAWPCHPCRGVGQRPTPSNSEFPFQSISVRQHAPNLHKSAFSILAVLPAAAGRPPLCPSVLSVTSVFSVIGGSPILAVFVYLRGPSWSS